MQQMGPSGMQPSRVHPDQIVTALMPLVEDAASAYSTGLSLQSALREAVLAGYLAGRGLAPAAAWELVQQWRMAGVSRELTRTPRTEMEPPQIMRPLPGQVSGEERAQLARQIEKFMQDQISATAFYGELEQMAKNPANKDYINHAREDEQKHYRMLGELYRDLTDRTYEAKPQKVEYKDFPDGVKKAMDDEYAAFEEYRDVYLAGKTERIRRVFFELMTDELEHATRFNYVLQTEEGEEGED